MPKQIADEFIVRRIETRLREEDKIQDYVDLLETTLDRIDKDLAQMFQKANEDGNWSRSKLYKYNRANKLKQQIRKEIAKYANDFKTKLRDELAKEYKQQSLFVQDTISAATNKSFSKLPTQAVKTVAIDEAEIAGKTLTEYISQYSTDLAHRIQTDVFQGIALGENPKRVGQRLAQAKKMGKARAETTFRSWYNKILNDASFDTYDQAGVKKSIYDATLDTRTTMICASRDGKIYTLEEIRAMLPAHHNCRSTGRPIIPGVNYEKGKTYKNWLRDGRRSEQQLNKVSSKLENAYRNNRIGKDEYEELKSVLESARRSKGKVVSEVSSNYKKLAPDYDNKTLKGLKRSHKEVLKHGQKTGNERVATIYLKNGKKAFKSIDGEESRVTFSKNFIDKLRNADKNSIILTHNHPQSSSFSGADLDILARYNSIDAITIEGHNGTKYICRIRNGETNISGRAIKQLWKEREAKYRDFFRSKVIEEGIDSEKVWREHSHLIVDDLAEELDWEYTRILSEDQKKSMEEIMKGFNEWLEETGE